MLSTENASFKTYILKGSGCRELIDVCAFTLAQLMFTYFMFFFSIAYLKANDYEEIKYEEEHFSANILIVGQFTRIWQRTRLF